MIKQELLTKLAIKCSTWAAARSDITWHNYQVSDEEALQIDEEEWLAERERLLNKPSWDAAPLWATHLGTTGKYWHWLLNACRDDRIRCSCYYVADKSQVSNKIIAIPAGYDWKESLEERPK